MLSSLVTTEPPPHTHSSEVIVSDGPLGPLAALSAEAGLADDAALGADVALTADAALAEDAACAVDSVVTWGKYKPLQVTHRCAP